MGDVTYEELKSGDKVILDRALLHWYPDIKVGDKLKLNIHDGDNTFQKEIEVAAIGEYGTGLTKGVEIAQAYCDKLRTKTPSVFQLVKNLSGGNQQKVVISKWLAEGSELFIFDEPTVGVDVGAKLEIYKVFETLIKEGKTIIIVSSYLPEVMGLSDRMLVMYEGKQMGILNKDEYQDERILRLASGIREKEKAV